MNFYKSKTAQGRLDEAIKILEKEVIREHKKEDMDFKMNKKEMRDISIRGFKNRANVYRRFTQSAEHKYEMSQLVRQQGEIRQKNVAIINEDIRLQLAKTIKLNLLPTDERQQEIGIFAIEQLLQKKENLPNPEGMVSVSAFNDRIHKINVGIRKVKYFSDASKFSEESASIEKQYTSSYDKLKYLSDILQKSHKKFGEDAEGVKRIEAIETGIVKTGTLEALRRANALKSEVQESLDKHGITTGFDTFTQTMWKKIKQLVKRLFGKKTEMIGDGENNPFVELPSDLEERVKVLEVPMATKTEEKVLKSPKGLEESEHEQD